LETVIAIGSVSVLFVGLASTLMIANRTATAPILSRATVSGSSIATRVLSDLRSATRIISHSDHHIEFVNPDRDGDAIVDVVRYDYSAADHQLTRQLNSGTVEILSDDVRTCTFAVTSSETEETIPLTTESSTANLFGTTPWLPPFTVMTPAETFDVTSPNLVGQTFSAAQFNAIPADALWWRIDTIHCYTLDFSPNPAMWLQLRGGASDHRPTGIAVTRQLKPTTAGFGVVRYSFRLPEPICHLSNSEQLSVVLPDLPRQLTIDSVQGDMCRSTNAGATWEHEFKTLQYAVTGSYTTVTSTNKISQRAFTRVELTLQIGDQSSALIHTGTPLMNEPPDQINRWQARFDTDPTSVDDNADGVADWTASSFDEAELSQGSWQAPQSSVELRTASTHDFAGDVDVQLVVRCEQDKTPFGVFAAFPFHRDGAKCRGVALALGRQSDGLQSLRLYGGATVSAPMHTIVRDLPNRLIHVRLLSLAQLGQVVLWVDGRYLGSYPSDSVAWSDQFASLRTMNSSAQIDLFEISEFTSGL
jgi:hypothetical protein